MPAHDERRPFASCDARDVRAELGAIDGDVNEQDDQLPSIAFDHVENQALGHVAGQYVDVAAYGEHRSHLGKAVQHVEIADVTGVQDDVGLELAQPLPCRRVRLGMRVGHDGQAKAAILM
jgi:hypothetical protein